VHCSLVRARGMPATREDGYSKSRCEAGSGVPSLLFEAPVDNEAVEPIKRLMLAMLNHAVCCYQTGLHPQKTSQLHAFLEAEKWLLGSEPFSFGHVCSAVNIDAELVSSSILKD
jgi:hypothetical protein